MGNEEEAKSSEQSKASEETAMANASTKAPVPSWFTPKRYLLSLHFFFLFPLWYRFDYLETVGKKSNMGVFGFGFFRMFCNLGLEFRIL